MGLAATAVVVMEYGPTDHGWISTLSHSSPIHDSLIWSFSDAPNDFNLKLSQYNM
jgi:hypothetical protein